MSTFIRNIAKKYLLYNFITRVYKSLVFSSGTTKNICSEVLRCIRCEDEFQV